MENETVSIILTVHNQEEIIGEVFSAIIENMSKNTKELIVILDGCTDNSEREIDKHLINAKNKGVDIKIIITPDVNEVIANNVGLKNSTCKYSLLVQDDCKITEKDFDLRMLKPFQVVPNLIAVSGRDAVDTRLVDGKLDYYNVGGKDVGTQRHVFSIRDAVNRSPLMLNNEMAKEMGYFDEDFAPLDSDDVDLCIRAYKEKYYLCGSYVIEFESPLHWGKTRSDSESAKVWEKSMIKNHKLIVDRHYDFITGKKHSRDMGIV